MKMNFRLLLKIFLVIIAGVFFYQFDPSGCAINVHFCSIQRINDTYDDPYSVLPGDRIAAAQELLQANKISYEHFRIVDFENDWGDTTRRKRVSLEPLINGLQVYNHITTYFFTQDGRLDSTFTNLTPQLYEADLASVKIESKPQINELTAVKTARKIIPDKQGYDTQLGYIIYPRDNDWNNKEVRLVWIVRGHDSIVSTQLSTIIVINAKDGTSECAHTNCVIKFTPHHM